MHRAGMSYRYSNDFLTFASLFGFFYLCHFLRGFKSTGPLVAWHGMAWHSIAWHSIA